MNSNPQFQRFLQHFLRKFSLQNKILILFTGASLLVLLLAILYIGTRTKEISIKNAQAQMGTTAEKFAESIKAHLEKELEITRTLSGTMQTHKLLPKDKFFDIYTNIYKDILNKNSDIIAVWDSWELKHLDSTYSKDFGRYKTTVWRENGEIKQKLEHASATGDSNDYLRIKKEKLESLEEPYFDTYDSNSNNKILMTSIIVPTIINDQFVGLVGIDIPLSNYYTVFKHIKPYAGSYAFLLSNSYKYIAYPDNDFIGQSALNEYEEIFIKNGTLDKISNGDPAFFEAVDVNGVESYFTIQPILVGNCSQHWSMVIVVPKKTIVHESTIIFWRTILLGMLGAILLSVFIYYASKRFVIKPIYAVIKNLERLSQGHVSEEMIVTTEARDEIGTMVNHLSQTIKGLSQKIKFAKEIGGGNYKATLSLLSEDDSLGKSLIDMGANLRLAQEEERKYKVEDEKRQWINEGLAKFADILRQDNDKIDVLSANIIKNLVGYLNASQGGLFIYNDDDPNNPFFDLLAAYAYNRQKFITKQVLLGEGLIGTCAIEKQTIHLTDIPENYIAISSGLGEAKPRSLIIVPMKVNDNVLGIIEIASFNKFENFQIDFVEKVAQSIAQTLISVRINIRTTELLEKSQQQAEEMKAQEEEVRQNLEELATIKEELEKRNEEFMENQKKLEWEKSLLDALLNYLPDKIYFKNLKSQFIKVSKSTLVFFGLEKYEDLEGKSDFDFFDEEHARPAYEDEQKIIRTDTPAIGIIEKEILADGRANWAETSKLPLKTSTGEIIGTFGITRDITSTKVMEEELEKRNKEILSNQKTLQWEKSLLDALLDHLPDRIYFKDVSSRFIKASMSTVKFFGLNKPEELAGKSDFDFFDDVHALPAFEDEQRIMKTDTPVIGLVEKEVLADGKVTWAETSKLPLKTAEGELIGTFGITRDITHAKQIEEELEKRNAIIEENQKILIKKSTEMENLYEAIRNSNFVIEYDTKGYIISINQAYLDLLQIKAEDIVGQHHSYLMEFTEEQRKNYESFWNDLNRGLIRKETHKFTVNSKKYLFYETYTPLNDENGTVYKILKIAVNVSHLLKD